MNTKLKIICGLLGLALSGHALAKAPSPVTNVSAIAENGAVTVEWDAVTSDPIEYYRVYYSSQSILQNDGLYDDFEVTEGDETTLTFVPPSGMDMLYVAVIAVTTGGTESEFFTQEASVDLTGMGTASSAQEQNSSAMMESSEAMQQESSSVSSVIDSSTARLLKGTVVSPTRMVIEFSVSMTVEASKAPQNLSIDAPDGSKLQIKNITIEGKTITINTATQTKGVVYNVHFGDAFMGTSGQPLDTDDRSVLLTGHADGNAPAATQTQQQQPAIPANPLAPQDLANVTIVPELQQDGAYTVTLRWDPVDTSTGNLYGIVVYQTRDGRNFGPPSLLPLDVGGVQLQGVTPGFYGMYLQVVNSTGYVSPGVFQYVTLPVYVPGSGFQGNLTFGGTQQKSDPQFDTVDDNMATIDVITDDSPLHTIDGIEHAAAPAEADTKINWVNAGILAMSAAAVLLLIAGGIMMLAKKDSSAA